MQPRRCPTASLHADSGEGVGLLVDRRQDWLHKYLAGLDPRLDTAGHQVADHQPRYLSTTAGCSSTAQTTSSRAANAKEDVYEYEPDGLGSCQANGMRLADLLRQRQAGIGVPRRQRKRRRRLLPHRPAARRRGPRHQLRRVRRPRLHQQLTLPDRRRILAEPCETSRACKPGTIPPPTVVTPATATDQALPAADGSPDPKAASKPKPLTRAQKLAKASRYAEKTATSTNAWSAKNMPASDTGRRPRPKKPASGQAGAQHGRRRLLRWAAARVRSCWWVARRAFAAGRVIWRLESNSAPTFLVPGKEARIIATRATSATPRSRATGAPGHPHRQAARPPARLRGVTPV